MAMYYCNECGDLKDGDYHPCEEDPRPSEHAFSDLLCPACAAELREAGEIPEEDI